jgi:hypothetical protein
VIALRLRDSYDVPEDVAAGPHSPAFGKFLWNWFGDTSAVTHGELDLTFLNDLAPEELSLSEGADTAQSPAQVQPHHRGFVGIT